MAVYGAPEEYKNRAIFWNAVEQVEKASNSQLAREIEIALPRELSYFQKSSLAYEFIKENFTSKGMIADINFHDLDSHNPHVHVMLTLRPFNEDGTWGDKQRKVYHLDENGDKIYDPIKRQYKCSKEQTTDWNERHKELFCKGGISNTRKSNTEWRCQLTCGELG